MAAFAAALISGTEGVAGTTTEGAERGTSAGPVELAEKAPS